MPVIPEGCVAVAVALDVISKASGICDFSLIIEGDTVTIIKNGIPEVIELPKVIGRRMLQRIANKYGVKIEWFYHPHLFVNGGNTVN